MATDPLSMTNVLGGAFGSFQKWVLPIGIIIALVIVLVIVKTIQKRAYEKNLEFKRNY